VTYLSPLGYLLGLEGAALLRGLNEGQADRAFVDARISEIRALLDTAELAEGATATPGAISTGEVYRSWASHYDTDGNQLIDVEQPIVHRILDGLPVGTALDAACGTGRHAAYLDARGHRVIGCDSSAEMLAYARKRLPNVDLCQADLHRLPVPDGAIDTIVCALALTHVQDLTPVLAEFARVLRPGGHLVISDSHLIATYLTPISVRTGPDGPAIWTNHGHLAADYLKAALPAGFHVRHCEEPRRPPSARASSAPDSLPAPGSWDVMNYCPAAAAAALDGSPIAIIWHFQKG
jgi:SAM-dependent methyltransferase